MARSMPPKAFWPLVIDATNNKIDFTVNATPQVATVLAKTYYSAGDLLSEVQLALVAWAGWSVTLAAAGHFVLTWSTADAVVLKFATGANAASSIHDVLGFAHADVTMTTGVPVTGAYQHANGWYPERPVVFDSREEYERTTAGTISLEGQHRLLTFGSAREIRRVELAWLPEWKTKIAREGTHANEALERLWREGFAKFRWWPDATVEGVYSDVSLDASQLGAFAPGRDDRLQLYSYTLKMRKIVT